MECKKKKKCDQFISSEPYFLFATYVILYLKRTIDLIDSRGREGTKSVLQAIHSFPANVESWSILIAALLPRYKRFNRKYSLKILLYFSRGSKQNLNFIFPRFPDRKLQFSLISIIIVSDVRVKIQNQVLIG